VIGNGDSRATTEGFAHAGDKEFPNLNPLGMALR
jgi:hypothetical protein